MNWEGPSEAEKRTIAIGQSLLEERTVPHVKKVAAQIERGMLTPAEAAMQLRRLADEIERWS